MPEKQPFSKTHEKGLSVMPPLRAALLSAIALFGADAPETSAKENETSRVGTHHEMSMAHRHRRFKLPGFLKENKSILELRAPLRRLYVDAVLFSGIVFKEQWILNHDALSKYVAPLEEKYLNKVQKNALRILGSALASWERTAHLVAAAMQDNGAVLTEHIDKKSATHVQTDVFFAARAFKDFLALSPDEQSFSIAFVFRQKYDAVRSSEPKEAGTDVPFIDVLANEHTREARNDSFGVASDFIHMHNRMIIFSQKITQASEGESMIPVGDDVVDAAESALFAIFKKLQRIKEGSVTGDVRGLVAEILLDSQSPQKQRVDSLNKDMGLFFSQYGAPAVLGAVATRVRARYKAQDEFFKLLESIVLPDKGETTSIL